MGAVLVVETDPDTRSQIEPVVAGIGIDLLRASSLREALMMISDGGIDVVILDSYDPRVGVIELARSMDALPDAPPLVLISRSPHAPEISARIGAAAFLAKPLDQGELAAVVERLLGDVRPVRVVNDEPSVPTPQSR